MIFETNENGGIYVIEAVSCGGVVIYRGKVLLLYKNQNGRYMGWVLPKGTVEKNEPYKKTALREVKEEAGASAKIIDYIGKTHYNFQADGHIINKTVHWYLMTTDSFYSKPQKEEFFVDAGFYKKHEAIYLLKFQDEKKIMSTAFSMYNSLKISINRGFIF